MKVYLIGVGMGNPDTLTLAARRAIDESCLLIGAPRLLEGYAGKKLIRAILSRCRCGGAWSRSTGAR